MACIFKQKAHVYAIAYLLLIPLYAIVYSQLDLSLNTHEPGASTYIYFSVVSITTLGYGDILPKGSVAQLVTASESLFGIILIGLFLNALSLQHSQELDKIANEKAENDRKNKALNRLKELTFYRGADESFRLFGALKYALSLGIEKVSIPEGKLTKLKIESIRIKESNLIAVDFSDSTLSKVTLKNCELEAAKFIDTTLKSCSFIGVNLRRAKFIKSKMKGMNFQECDIKGATFKSCQLQSAIFKGLDCKGVSFKGCDLRSANFIDAKNITEEMIKEAKHYEYAKLPNGKIINQEGIEHL